MLLFVLPKKQQMLPHCNAREDLSREKKTETILTAQRCAFLYIFSVEKALKGQREKQKPLRCRRERSTAPETQSVTKTKPGNKVLGASERERDRERSKKKLMSEMEREVREKEEEERERERAA